MCYVHITEFSPKRGSSLGTHYNTEDPRKHEVHIKKVKNSNASVSTQDCHVHRDEAE